MRSIRISSLQWTAALVCTLTGAILLVSPHQLNVQSNDSLTSSTFLMGILYLLVGLGLASAMAFRLPNPVSVFISIISGILIEVLAWLFGARGMWVAAVFTFTSGFFIWVAAYLSRQHSLNIRYGSRDLLSFGLGVSSLLSGLLMLIRSDLFRGPFYHLISPHFWLFAAAFLLCGVWLTSMQIYAWMVEPTLETRRFWILNTGAHFATTGLVGIYLLQTMLPAGMTGLLLVFAMVFIILAIVPYMGSRLDQNAPYLLSTRLAILLALTAIIPLVLTVTFISNREERMVRSDALAQQQTLASAIANGIDDYTGLHMDAIVSLARNPDLLTMSHADQVDLLRSAEASFPDVLAFALVASDGIQLVRSDNATTTVSLKGYPVYENARSTLQPSHDVLMSPVYHRPVVALGAPISDSSGRFAGMVTAALDSRTVSSYVAQHSEEPGSLVLLVDENGRVISSPDQQNIQALTNLSKNEPVRNVLGKTDIAGSFNYYDSGKEQLAGYARVTGLNWLVVVDRPEENALASVYFGREVAFDILVGSLLFTIIAGILLAKWSTSPLNTLVRAVEALGMGETSLPVNRNKIVEVDRLADAFDMLQERLTQRTAETQQAEDALRQANQALTQMNAELEDRVAERTRDLQREQALLEQRVEERTRDLSQEIEEREKVEQALQSSLLELKEANSQLDQQFEALTIASEALEGARKAVEDERYRYQNLFDFAPDGYLVTDLYGKIIEANRAAGSLTGVPFKKLIGKYLVSFVILDERKDFRGQLNLIAEGIHLGRTYQTWEHRLEPHFGPSFEAEMTVLGIHGEKEDEKDSQLRWLIRDITNRKQTEARIRQGTRMATALAHISKAVMEAGYDYQGILEIVTREASDLFGDFCVIRTASTDREWLLLASMYNNDPVRSRSQEIEIPHAYSTNSGLSGKVFRECEPALISDLDQVTEIHPTGRSAVDRLGLKTLMIVPLRSHNQVLGVMTVGRKFPCMSYTREDLALLQTLADRIAQAITNVQLYNDLENAYQEEQKMRAQLILAEKHSALSRMVASVAHELNNPIQTVQNCLFLIQSELPKTVELQEYLEMAVSETKRVSNLVTQLRESYRPNLAGEKQIIELNQLLNQVEALLAAHLAHEKVSWRQVPKRGSVLVEAFPDQLKQVFINISLNAIEAMQPGGGVLDVSLDVNRSQKIVLVNFRDSGPGIPPETLKKIFEPFFTTKPTGTGLGLSICYEIVSSHGGDIQVESEPGEGSCFKVKLPLA
jgi:PAS domain S-box-containing protein